MISISNLNLNHDFNFSWLSTAPFAYGTRRQVVFDETFTDHRGMPLPQRIMLLAFTSLSPCLFLRKWNLRLRQGGWLCRRREGRCRGMASPTRCSRPACWTPGGPRAPQLRPLGGPRGTAAATRCSTRRPAAPAASLRAPPARARPPPANSARSSAARSALRPPEAFLLPEWSAARSDASVGSRMSAVATCCDCSWGDGFVEQSALCPNIRRIQGGSTQWELRI